MNWQRLPVPLAVTALLAAVVLLLVPIRSAPVAAQQGAGDTRAADEAAIKKNGADYVAAMIKGDIDAVMSFWDPDADYVDETGKVTRGKEALTTLFKAALPDLKGAKITGKCNSLKFLRGQIALEDGTLTMTAPDGTTESNRYAVVWSKSGDKWLIASARDLPTEVTEVPSGSFPQLKSMEWLVGEWEDDAAKADVQLTCKWSENKAFMLMEYVIKREGDEPLSVTQRVGWDPLNTRVRSWVFDSQGGFGEGFWQRDGNNWVIGASGVLPDGGTGGSTNHIEFKDGNSFTWRSKEREVDGQPVADAEVKFVRKGAKKEGGAP